MKPERISIFNYEAFYLDYLEGNLGVEDTALLLVFLEENPELKMEDEDLPVYDSEDYLLTQNEKLELKQSDEDEVIILENAEYFMIAEVEGLLSEGKKSELDDLIVGKPELEKDRAIFAAVTMKPDLGIVYSEKNDLKRKVVVLWPYVALAAAASVLIAFFLLTNNQSEKTPSFAKETDSTEESTDQNQDKLEEDIVAQQLAEEINEPQEIGTDKNEYHSIPVTIQPDPKIVQSQRATMARLEKRELRLLVHTIEGVDLEPISRALPNVVETETASEGDVAYTGFEHMTDPIQGITSRLNKRMKSEVEFKTAKATKDKSGGFFLKIGKFELARKKRK